MDIGCVSHPEPDHVPAARRGARHRDHPAQQPRGDPRAPPSSRPWPRGSQPVAPARATTPAGAAGTGFQYVETLDWIPLFGIQYKVGVDGLSVAMVVLTTTLTWISILASFSPIKERVKEYMISFLVLEVGMLGVFVSLDLFLFYIFWEVVLVPMYLIIGIWGGANRIYATIKFVLYTLVGSLLMLVAILATAFAYQAATGSWDGAFDLQNLRRPRLRSDLPALRVRGLRPGLRDQGPDVPVPHLAPGRPRGGADGRLGDPGRRAAQARRLRVHPLRAADLPGGGARLRPADHPALGDRDHLRRDRGPGPARPQEAGRLQLGEPHGLRDARDLHLPAAGHARARSCRWSTTGSSPAPSSCWSA